MNDILAALDNVLNDGQAHQMTQDTRDIFKQPPGAAITGSPSLTRLRQASFLQSIRPSTSHSTPRTGINPLSQGRPSSHCRASSQPCPMPSTQAILGGGCGHADASLYAGMPQLILKSPSEPPQSTPLPVSLNASLLSPPPHPQQSPEPAPWSLRTHSSGANANHVENAQIPMILTPHFLENQSIHSPFPGHPGFSPVTSSARFPTADFTDTEPSLLSHTQDDSLGFLNLSSPSGMQVDFITAPLSAGPGYPGALSQAAVHTPTQQATPPASPDSQPTEQHPTGKRRRLSVPKDPRAAKRLRTQRQGDDENLEALYKLLVPRGAGVVQKKDRLSMILRYARKWMQTQGGSIQQSTLEQTRDCRSTSPSGSQQGESMESY